MQSYVLNLVCKVDHLFIAFHILDKKSMLRVRKRSIAIYNYNYIYNSRNIIKQIFVHDRDELCPSLRPSCILNQIVLPVIFYSVVFLSHNMCTSNGPNEWKCNYLRYVS